MTPTDDEVVLPALLRAARGAYGRAVTAHLERNGFTDIPRNGSFVLGGIVNHGGRTADLVRQLGVSKQAAALLVDTLVLRGYLRRDVDPADGRRMTVSATERGVAAAAAIQQGVESVDDELVAMITPAELVGLRTGLIALCEIRDRRADEADALGTEPGRP